MREVLWFILSVGEFWAATGLALWVKVLMPTAPLVLFVPVFWLLIHFGVPKIFGENPLW